MAAVTRLSRALTRIKGMLHPPQSATRSPLTGPLVKRFIPVILINLAVLVLGLLVLEAVAGTWFRDDPWARLTLLRDRTWHYRVEGLYPWPQPTVAYSRDRWALRGAPADPAAVDLVTLGGSTTDQRFLADGATWQDVLQAQLAARGHPLLVANAGVDGQTSRGHQAALDEWFPLIPGFAPRHYLFYVGLNDLALWNAEGYDRLDAAARLGSGPLNAVRRHSALFRVYRRLQGISTARAAGASHERIDFASIEWTTTPAQADHAALLSDHLIAYEARLERLVATARARGGSAILATQPARFARTRPDGTREGTTRVWTYRHLAFNGLDCDRGLDLLNAATRRVAARLGVTLLDPAANLSWEDTDFYDHMHLTPAGAAKLGEYFAGQLTASPAR